MQGSRNGVNHISNCPLTPLLGDHHRLEVPGTVQDVVFPIYNILWRKCCSWLIPQLHRDALTPIPWPHARSSGSKDGFPSGSCHLHFVHTGAQFVVRREPPIWWHHTWNPSLSHTRVAFHLSLNPLLRMLILSSIVCVFCFIASLFPTLCLPWGGGFKIQIQHSLNYSISPLSFLWASNLYCQSLFAQNPSCVLQKHSCYHLILGN